MDPFLLRVIVDHCSCFATGQNLFFGIITYHSGWRCFGLLR